MNFRLEVSLLGLVQGKEPQGTVRLEPGLQASPEKGGKHNIETEIQFGPRPRLTVVEAQVLLGIAEGKLNLAASPVAVEEADLIELGVAAVQEHVPGCLRVGPAGNVHHPQLTLPGLAVQLAVAQVHLRGRRRPTVCKSSSHTSSTKSGCCSRRPQPPSAPAADSQPRLLGLPASGTTPPRWPSVEVRPARLAGRRGLPGAEGIASSTSTAASSVTSSLQRTARAMPRQNQPVPQVPLFDTKLASRTSSTASLSGTRECTAAKVPTAKRAKGKGRANHRAWVRAARRST